MMSFIILDLQLFIQRFILGSFSPMKMVVIYGLVDAVLHLCVWCRFHIGCLALSSCISDIATPYVKPVRESEGV